MALELSLSDIILLGIIGAVAVYWLFGDKITGKNAKANDFTTLAKEKVGADADGDERDFVAKMVKTVSSVPPLDSCSGRREAHVVLWTISTSRRKRPSSSTGPRPVRPKTTLPGSPRKPKPGSASAPSSPILKSGLHLLFVPFPTLRAL